jgi:hypothetical protein
MNHLGIYLYLSFRKISSMSEIKELQCNERDTETSERKEITKIFLSGRLSATLIIPIEMARRHGLEKPSHVVIEERPDGILIKKLEL